MDSIYFLNFKMKTKMFNITNHWRNGNQILNDHLTSARMATVKKMTQYGKGRGEKGTFTPSRWERKLVQPPCRTIGKFLKN